MEWLPELSEFLRIKSILVAQLLGGEHCAHLDPGRRALGRGRQVTHRYTEKRAGSLRCRTDEAIALVDDALAARRIEAGELTLGTDSGSAFTSRRSGRCSRRSPFVLG